MQIDVSSILNGTLLMLIGALGSGSIWAVKVIFKIRRDLDHAFIKIRAMESDYDRRACEDSDGTFVETGD